MLRIAQQLEEEERETERRDSLDGPSHDAEATKKEGDERRRGFRPSESQRA